jgi:hypothetical protein
MKSILMPLFQVGGERRKHGIMKRKRKASKGDYSNPLEALFRPFLDLPLHIPLQKGLGQVGMFT